MPETKPPDADAMFQFTCHVLAICAIAILSLALDAAHPNDPSPLALLPLAATTRWVERLTKRDRLTSTIVLDIALGMMTADIIASWTSSAEHRKPALATTPPQGRRSA